MKKLIVPNFDNNVYYKNNPILFLQLKDLVELHLKGFQRCLNSKCTKKQYTDYSQLAKWINQQLPLLNDNIYKWNTKCYWILFGLTNFPVCLNPNCKKYIGKNLNIKITRGYSKYCCSKCSATSPITRYKCEETTFDRYQVKNINQLDVIKDKKREYFLENYGVTCSLQIDEVQAKIKADNIKNFGVEYYIQTKECQEKTKNTLSSTYGKNVLNPRQIPGMNQKLEATCLKHFGVPFAFQAESVKQKIKKTLKKNFGVECAAKSYEIMKKMKSKYFYNNIYFDSAPELALYIFCQDKEIIFQYHPDILFEYEYNNITHRYFPDFLIESTFVEIKSDQMVDHLTGKWICPWNRQLDELYEAKHQFLISKNIKILYSNDYKKYLKYIDEKYGKKYLQQFKNTKT